MIELQEKIKELTNKIKTLNINNTIFYNKLVRSIDDIIDYITDYQLNNISELEMTKELNKQIEEAKKIEKFMAIFGQLVINYTINS